MNSIAAVSTADSTAVVLEMQTANFRDPVQRAYAAAAVGFSAIDWIDRCRKAGMSIYEHDDTLAMIYNDANTQECRFLNCWISLVPGGIGEVIDELRDRSPTAPSTLS